ncbi:MAG: efflux RND transporter periplasmic adaptor subunit, partial [Algiphilus sp.]
MTTKRMIIMLVLVGLVFGGVFGMKEFGRRAMVSFLEQMPTPPATVSSSEVGTMRWNSRLRSVGSLVVENGTNVTNEAAGIITKIHFQSGDTVEAGELLLELDSDTEAAQLDRLEAEAELAELTRKRRERLFELNSLSKAELDEAVSQANVAKAAVKAQRALLEQKRIRAPFAGKLGIRRVSIGQFVDAGTPMVALESVDPMEVEFSLPEAQLSKVSPGQRVKVRVDGYPDDVFEGEILALESRVDSDTRNFDVRAR